jgi:hypothetical protein
MRKAHSSASRHEWALCWQYSTARRGWREARPRRFAGRLRPLHPRWVGVLLPTPLLFGGARHPALFGGARHPRAVWRGASPRAVWRGASPPRPRPGNPWRVPRTPPAWDASGATAPAAHASCARAAWAATGAWDRAATEGRPYIDLRAAIDTGPGGQGAAPTRAWAAATRRPYASCAAWRCWIVSTRRVVYAAASSATLRAPAMSW